MVIGHGIADLRGLTLAERADRMPSGSLWQGTALGTRRGPDRNSCLVVERSGIDQRRIEDVPRPLLRELRGAADVVLADGAEPIVPSQGASVLRTRVSVT